MPSTPLKMPIGQSDFSPLIRKNYYFVDKSLFIQEMLEDSADFIREHDQRALSTAPRKFNKEFKLK